MATFHCQAKVGKSCSGGAHADYIEREGKYASKSKEDLEHKESGNLPSFAETSAEFWRASDKGEGKKKIAYREYEIALPRELTKEQRLELVREFVRQEIGDKYTYTFAIHNPTAAIEGGEQPHAHIMFSERIIDGIDRPAEQYFMRWNAKNPERGGAKKGNNDFKTQVTRSAELVQLRQRFAELQNKHLARHGHSVQVTHLSLKAQGIDREVEPHLGPDRAKELAQAVKIDRLAEKTPNISPRLGREEAINAVHDELDRNATVNGKIALNGVYEAAAVARKWLEKQTHPEKEMLSAYISHWTDHVGKAVQQQAKEQERAQPKQEQGMSR